MVRKLKREARDTTAALLEARAAAREPAGKAAWKLSADRCHAEVAQLTGEIQARVTRLGEAVERFGAVPPAGHGRTRRTWTVAIRRLLDDMEGGFARERTEHIEPALGRVEGGHA